MLLISVLFIIRLNFLSRLIALTLFCIGVYSQKAKPATSFDQAGCELKYLKDEGFLPLDFPSQPPKSPCEKLDSFVKETFSKLRTEYEKIYFGGDCVEKALKKAKFQRFVFLKGAYTKATHLTDAVKTQKLKEVKDEEKKVSAEILPACIDDTKFNELFDHLYNEAPDDNKEDYCVRKYVLDNKILDSRYNVQLNPKSIKTSNINCVPLIEENRKDVEKSFTEHRNYSLDKKICIRVVFKNGKYFDNVAAVTLLKTSNLTKEQLATERTKFINAMIRSSKESVTCVGE